jgi:uncharacterized membrane protein
VKPARKTPAAVLVAVVVLSNTLGNFFMSRGLRHHGAALKGWENIEALLNPWVGLGIALLLLWLISRLWFFKLADLTYVVPATSVGYILNALLGQTLLSEQVSPKRWLGTLLIVAGAAVVGRTEMRQ